MEAREALAAADVSILIISQAKPTIAARFLQRYPQPVPVVCDPDRRLYQFLALGRTQWWNFLRPSVLLGYLWHIARGVRILRPYEGEDVYQLGGDFVIDGQGNIVYAFRSRTATDRPPIQEILGCLGAG